MDVLNLFMRELFDFNTDFSSHLDTQTNSIKMGSVIKDAFICKNLIFRYLWKTVYGVWPSRLHGSLFMEKNRLTSQIEIEDFITFCREMMPIYNYVQIDLGNLEKGKQAFMNELRSDPKKIKEQLALKFCYRYGVEEDKIINTDSLFNIFKTCVFDKDAFERIKILNNGLAKQQGKEIFNLPETPLTLNAYYEISSQMVEYYELGSYNIFNRYWNNHLDNIDIGGDNTVFDVVNFTASRDSSFNRFLLGSVAIYYESGNVDDFNRLSNLIAAANSKDNKSIVLFKQKDFFMVDESTYVLEWDMFDPFYMNYVPRSTSNFIMISKNMFPTSPSISLKHENAIYYCLYESKNKKSDHYLASFNRYLCDENSHKHLSELGEVDDIEKTLYIIADEDDKNNNIINNKHFIEHQWNAHLVTPCPYKSLTNNTYQTRFNVLLYDQFLFKYYKEHSKDIDKIVVKTSKTKKNVLVMIDNRPNIFSIICLKTTMCNLKQDEWSVLVFCNETNKEFFQKYLGCDVDYVTKFNLPPKKFDIEIYNNLLKNPLFWGSISNYDNVLFIQDDCILAKKGVEDKFLQYDYVGAPWEKKWATQGPNKYLLENVSQDLVGNGGLSLRKIKHMKMICEKYRHISHQLHYDRLQQQPEDVFFSFCCQQEKLNTPKYEEAQLFSSEQVYNPNSIGFHKTWVYHPLAVVTKLFNNYLVESTNKFLDVIEPALGQ